jgi:L-ascorbate metabolism protein UlaG (beta-lactamase superfamily)
MFKAVRHAAGLVGSAATRRSRLRNDARALAELETQAPDLPTGLEIEWLGVSGYRLTYEARTLYIDPYLSRVPLSHLLRRRAALPDPRIIDRFLPSNEDVVGLLVGHTHWDHAVDAPAIARRTACKAYGSSSLARLMRLHGLGDRAVEVEPYRTYELGPFEVTFVPSAHSKLLLGLAVPFAGELTCEQLDGLAPGAYRCGQVWGIHVAVAGISLYHQGSADLIDDAVRHRGVDLFLAGIAGRNFTDRYWERILSRLDPAAIVPTHYDDFFTPLEADMELMGNARIAELEGEVGRVSRAARVLALPRLTRLAG